MNDRPQGCLRELVIDAVGVTRRAPVAAKSFAGPVSQDTAGPCWPERGVNQSPSGARERVDPTLAPPHTGVASKGLLSFGRSRRVGASRKDFI